MSFIGHLISPPLYVCVCLYACQGLLLVPI